MSKKSASLLTIFSYLPWWASVIAGVVVYISLTYVFPNLVTDNQIVVMVAGAGAGRNIAFWFSLLFLIPRSLQLLDTTSANS